MKSVPLTEEQIKGNIADIEGKLSKLAQDHQNVVNQFNQIVAQNQANYNHLQGQLATWNEMLPKRKKKKAESP